MYLKDESSQFNLKPVIVKQNSNLAFVSSVGIFYPAPCSFTVELGGVCDICHYLQLLVEETMSCATTNGAIPLALVAELLFCNTEDYKFIPCC